MCFPTARCAVGEHGGIVPIKNTIQQGSRSGFVDFALRGILVEYTVETEGLVFDSLAGGDDRAGEFLDRVVFGRIKDSRSFVSLRPSRSESKGLSVQAFIVNDLDHGTKAFLGELWGWGGRQRAITEEDCGLVAFCELRSFSDCKRPHSDSD